MRVNLIIVKDNVVVDVFNDIKHYYKPSEDTVVLADGTEIGGINVDYYLCDCNYEIGQELSTKEVEELDSNGYKKEFLKLTLEQKLDLLNL